MNTEVRESPLHMTPSLITDDVVDDMLLETSSLGLTDDQAKAYEAILNWLRDSPVENGKPFFRLSGYAGSGKTTLVGKLVAGLRARGVRTTVNTFAWKAALVLQSKGIYASSIHSLFYTPLETGKDGTPRFIRVPPEDIYNSFDLIVIDEASMVDYYMRQDIQSPGVPVLYVGDAGQLPPVSNVKDDAKFMAEAEATLETIKRVAAESPIINLSMKIRNGEFVPYKKFGVGVYKMHAADVTDDLMLKADVVICGKNKTRKALNSHMRKLRGYNTKMMPAKGEPLIGSQNCLTKGLYNGQVWYCAEDYSHIPLHEASNHYITITNEKGESRVVRCIFDEDYLFSSLSNEAVMAIIKEKELYRVDFAYAITCHKAQGSQYRFPIIYEERLGNSDFHKRWLYTAVTRSSGKLIISN